MKIEKGKFYRTRGGEKVEVLTTERKQKRNIIAMNEDGDLLKVHQNGMYFNDKSLSEYDLIAEWIDPVEIPWSDYPTWCNWVAMDEDGKWFVFVDKPERQSNFWFDVSCIRILTDYQPRNFTGDWTESLFERPNN